MCVWGCRHLLNAVSSNMYNTWQIVSYIHISEHNARMQCGGHVFIKNSSVYIKMNDFLSIKYKMKINDYLIYLKCNFVSHHCALYLTIPQLLHILQSDSTYHINFFLIIATSYHATRPCFTQLWLFMCLYLSQLQFFPPHNCNFKCHNCSFLTIVKSHWRYKFTIMRKKVMLQDVKSHFENSFFFS